MKKRLKELKYTVNPDLIPIRSNEVTFLVRFLHKMSVILNLMVSVCVEKNLNSKIVNSNFS